MFVYCSSRESEFVAVRERACAASGEGVLASVVCPIAATLSRLPRGMTRSLRWLRIVRCR